MLELKKRKLGERGIECIFTGHVEHRKTYRVLVTKPYDYIVVNTVIESRDAIFEDSIQFLDPRKLLQKVHLLLLNKVTKRS